MRGNRLSGEIKVNAGSFKFDSGYHGYTNHIFFHLLNLRLFKRS